MSRSLSPRSAVLITLAALALVGGLLVLVPRGGPDEGALHTSGQVFAPAALGRTAGFGTMTPALKAEVDRVVAQGEALGRRWHHSGQTGKAALYGNRVLDRAVRTLVRCADFDGQTYCLGSGWTEDTQAEVQARTEVEARASLERSVGVERTGDLDASAMLAQRAAMSMAARARAERAELTMAARSVAKVWLLRHDVEGEPLPPDFLADHPEARAAATPQPAAQPAAQPEAQPAAASPTAEPTLISLSTSPTPTPAPSPTTPLPTTSPGKTYDEYPESAAVLDPNDVADQTRTYYCGPTTMQMIAWGWKGKLRSQDHWAAKLGTTSSGTSISAMVAVTNKKTGWDGPSYAGPYVALDISHFTFDQWELLVMHHIVDLRSPMILHVVLQKQFFPYLDHDGSGHFQVGRGYDKRGTKSDLIGYFEPWNQQRFHSDEPFISRVQWRSSYRTYRATEAHYQHDVGV